MFRLENVRVTPDSAVGLVGGTWQGRRLADIAQITVKSRARGAWEGLKIGAGAGVLLGAVSYDERTCRDALGILCDRTSYTILNGIGGAIWGLIIGPMIGSRIRYVVGGR